MARQSRRFLCLFWRETKQRILGPEISPYLEVVRGRERELAGKRSWQAVGDWTAERRVSREELAWNHGQGQSTPFPETVAEKRGSSHGEEDRLKMSAFELLVEFSLVTHASVCPHMHVVLHNLLLLLVNPKLCSCLFVCFIFSCPPDRILVAVKKCALPLSDH